MKMILTLGSGYKTGANFKGGRLPMYKNKVTGDYFEFVRNFGPWMVLRNVQTKVELHISPEFMNLYEEVSIQ